MMRHDHDGPGVVARAVLVALMVLTGAVGTASAQDARHGALKRPTVGGHVFLSSDVVADPFVRSYVRQSLGIAQAVDLTFPLGIVDTDTLLLLQGDLTYAVLDFEYQQAVKDWLAARGRFNLRSRLGTDGTSLLTSGVQVSTGFEFGWLIRLLQTDRIALSASADVANRSSTVIDVGQFVRDLIAGVPDARLSDNVPSVRGSGGLRFAWGASRLFGLTALVDGGYGDAARRGENTKFLYTAGATLDFDLGAVTPVPVGIGLTYSQTSILQQVDADSDHRSAVVRIAYSGRPDFMIGLDIVGTAVRDVKIAETVKAVGALLTTRYYF